MKKILIGIVLAIVALLAFLNIGDKEKNSGEEDIVYKNTISISRSYVALRLKTDKILKEASNYKDYDSWNKEMTELLDNWENLELKAKELGKQADFGTEEKVSLGLVNVTHAYTKDEISNVFDKAPAGKKIRTLAKFLGVDAKRAFKILKNDQEFVKADAWNEAGDTFKKLETSAIVIKDGCKVAGFVGAMALTGGAVGTVGVGSAGVGSAVIGGSATVGQAVVMVVTGTDLVLEIGEDTATIALGDNHKGVKAISNMRSYTEPAASILSLTDIPKNVAKGAALLDKVGVVLIQVDQVRSMVQDGKLLGINIKPADKKAESKPKVEVATLEEDEVKKWIEEHKNEKEDNSDELDDWLDGFDDIDDWLDKFEDEDEDENVEGIEDEDADKERAVTKEDASNEDKIKSDSVEKKTEGEDLVKTRTKDGKVSITMINAIEPLTSGATQRWKVKVDGYERSGNRKGYNCYWDFHTEYSPGVEPWMNLMGCDRTNGVPGRFRPVGDSPGELRAVVRVDFLEYAYEIDEQGLKNPIDDKIVETVTLEKNYVITPWGGDAL